MVKLIGARGLVHHGVQVGISGILPQRRQHVVQVLLVNEAIPVLVNHVKGLFELLDLGLVKHGEHIGGCALRALLGGLGLCPFARHGGG